MDRRPGSESSPNLPAIAGPSGPVSHGSLERIDDFLERVLRVCQLGEEARRRRVEGARKAAPAPFHEHAEVAFVASCKLGELRTRSKFGPNLGGPNLGQTLPLDISPPYAPCDRCSRGSSKFGSDPPI